MTLTVEAWCEALESGKYRQGNGWLRVDDQFCCLGVACELSGAGDWEDAPAEDGVRSFTTGPYVSAAALPAPIQHILGLADDVGSFDPGSLPPDIRVAVGTLDALSKLNDAGVPFPLIAKVIRARPKGLFVEDATP